jgi:hypothetical protein
MRLANGLASDKHIERNGALVIAYGARAQDGAELHLLNYRRVVVAHGRAPLVLGVGPEHRIVERPPWRPFPFQRGVTEIYTNDSQRRLPEALCRAATKLWPGVREPRWTGRTLDMHVRRAAIEHK